MPQCCGTYTGGPIKHLIHISTTAAALYLLNRVILIPLFPEIGFLSSYMGDLLALPVFLPLSLVTAHLLGLWEQQRGVRFRQVLTAGLVFSLLFEGLVPLLDPSAIADLFDCLAYTTGGLVLWLMSRFRQAQNHPAG